MPACASFATAVAVYGGSYPSRIFEPDWLGTPSVQKRSLTASGTPASGACASTPSAGAASATQVKALRSSASAAARAR